MYYKKIHDDWGVGYEECNNGVVMFFSIEDRKYYFSVGKGVLNKLTSSVLEEIEANMKPYLKNKDYDNAILQSLNDVGKGLPGATLNNNSWLTIAFYLLIVLVILLIIYSSCVQGNRYSQCKKQLTQLEK